MNTWAPIFSKIVDSSLWSEDDYVVKVFLTLLALKDADHVVRFNAYAIGKKCWSGREDAEAKVLKALKVLEEPDTRRIEPQPHDGRRIQRVADGWLILNGQFYKEMMQKANRREYKRVKQAEYRHKKTGGGATERQYEKAVVNGDVPEQDRLTRTSAIQSKL